MGILEHEKRVYVPNFSTLLDALFTHLVVQFVIHLICGGNTYVQIYP